MTVAVTGVAVPRRLPAQSPKSDTGAVENVAKAEELSGNTLYIDQDTFVSPSSDQDYTMGVQFTHSGPWVTRHGLDRPLNALDRLLAVDRLHHRMKVPATGPTLYVLNNASIGVSAFTPSKGDGGLVLKQSEPIYNDRPYACLAYGTTQRVTARGRTALISGLTLGILGTDICKSFQSYVHKHITHDVKPGGWDNQISEGGEPTLGYQLAVRRLLFGVGQHWQFETVGYNPTAKHIVELSWDASGSAGYYTNMVGGARVRIGLIQSPFWAIDRRPVTPVTALYAPGPSPTHWYHLEEFFGWVSGGGTLWFYNSLLQGQFRHSRVTLDYAYKYHDPAMADLNALVTDWEWGVTVRLRAFSVTYQFNNQSPLFDGPNKRHHNWGGAYIAWDAGLR
jgi:hypothetical protein